MPDHPTGLVVPVRLPPRLARLRRRWDPAAQGGVPAHVTIIYPFVAPADLRPADRVHLTEMVAATPPFDVRFERLRRVDDGLLWIEPDPVAPFLALITAATTRWPDHPPYGGAYDEVVPHLTIVDAADAPLDAVETATADALPFAARATRLELWRQEADGRWHPHWRLRLGGP